MYQYSYNERTGICLRYKFFAELISASRMHSKLEEEKDMSEEGGGEEEED
jgi:hypothetical protein